MTEYITKSWMNDLSDSLRTMLLTILFCGFLYTGTIWIIGHVFAPEKAEGSLIHNTKGTVIGSKLIAQNFTKPWYFWPRPSAIDYHGQGSGGSNLSPNNPALRDRILKSMESIKNTRCEPVPVELVMASGSGLDPHIYAQSAYYQAERIASARSVDINVVHKLIDSKSSGSNALSRQSALINVLELNLLLDREFPLKQP